jgi:hypothetical protein
LFQVTTIPVARHRQRRRRGERADTTDLRLKRAARGEVKQGWLNRSATRIILAIVIVRFRTHAAILRIAVGTLMYATLSNICSLRNPRTEAVSRSREPRAVTAR